MSRSRRRISRALLGLLACTIALGLVFWLHNLNKTRAAEEASAAQAAADAVAPPPAGETPPAAARATPAEPVRQVALVTQTPTGPLAAAPAPAPGTITITPSAPPPAAQAHAPAPKGTASIHSAAPLADAKAKSDAGDLLTARTILNTALLAGNLSPADTAAARKMLADVNQVIVFSPRKVTDDEFGESYTVQSGDRMSRIAARHDVTWELLCRINGLSRPEKMRSGQTLKIVKGPFHAIVDKSDFTMDIYLGSPGEAGSVFVTSYRVGLGADDSTPTGTWSVEPTGKLKNPVYYSPRGGGVIEGDDPANPLGEFWIGLTGIDGNALGKESYGIHGTIEPDSIGKEASMGCIRLGADDIAMVYELLVGGKSTVIIRE